MTDDEREVFIAEELRRTVMPEVERSLGDLAKSMVKVGRQAQVQRTREIVAFIRATPPRVREDWGLNATEELADLIEGGAYLEEKTSPSGGEDPK